MSDSTRPPHEDPVRHHVYDGISEYDRRLPNWWLVTFYGAIIFSVIYWIVVEQISSRSDAAMIDQEMAKLEAVKLADAGSSRDDGSLWKMSRNPVFVDAGRMTFATTCASCHGPTLTGGIGPNLVDEVWIHGGHPMDITGTVEKGVAAKGMPAWGPVLGPKKINEVVAFILSHHPEPASSGK